MKLPGYHLGENLYIGTRTLIYRGERNSDRQPVIIKVLRNPQPSFKELVQFRNQYIITRNLENPRIVRPIALERYGNGYALVMPDDGAIALSDYWQQSEGSLSEFLEIAIQLSIALHYLSGERIIHKDIKPANILINPETGLVQVIDFSISSLLPREQQQLVNPKVLEGTLAYISPEQTGRMNRGIDYRTDFYSLGVTFFELLTGKRPFESSDPMELVHSHIAKMPPGLGNWARRPAQEGIGPGVRLRRELGKPTPISPLPGGGKTGGAIPEVIENIVRRLMAKNAEERYQSALGLKHDLERCRQEWEANREISNFELGENDRSDRFIIPEKLYGREREVEKLLEAFARVANPDGGLPLGKLGKGGQGRAEMMLVAGFSGIGKTAVVSEVHKPIVRQRGYFIKGKFDQFNRNIPFSAFVQAFRDLMGQLLGFSDADLAKWKEKILAALGENGQVLIEVIPELERIIGKQPPVPELSGNAAQNRFNLLFQRFIAVFTTAEHPLVMFLDDLQWADSASLNLMKVLMASGDTGYLLLLGAYRDNEVYPAHPLMLALSELEKERAVISTLVLEPLSLHHINQLVAATLSCGLELVEPLTELVYQKTKGNPFFTTQFLKGLHQDELIEFNRELGYWFCDLVRVRDAALTEDVVEFMAGRLALLPEATQKALKLAACIGNQFELETLATICEESSEEVARDIWSALQEGLILPISEAYKFFQGGVEEVAAQTVTVVYRFLHDRVQQAAYSLIPNARKQSTHLKIGRLLLENIPECDRDRRIFDIVNHFNLGRDLVNESEQRLQLAFLNLQAGQKARQGVAYHAAFGYISVGLEYLPDNSWQECYDLTLQLYREGVSAACTSGEFATMNQWSDIALARIVPLVQRIPFYETKIQACVAQKQLSEAIRLGLDILEKLGETFSDRPQPEDFTRSIQEISASLAGRTIADLIDLPAMREERGLAVLQVLWRLSSVLVMTAPKLMPFCTFKAVKLSIDAGNSVLSAPAYATYGAILCSAVGDIPNGYRFGKLALQIVEKYNGKVVYSKTLVRFTTGVRHWQDPLQDTLASLAEGYQLALEVGDLESAAICAAGYGYHAYFAGKELAELEREIDVYSQGIQAIQQQTVLYWNKIYHQEVLNLLGKSEIPWSLVGTAYDETVNLPMQQQYQDGVGLGIAYLFKSILCYLFNQFSLAIDNLDLAAKYIQRLAPFAHTSAFHFYKALTYLSSYAIETYKTEEDILEKVQPSRAKLQHWARYAPANYQHKYNLIEAEIYRLLGQKLEAMEMYDRAIAGAKENEYIQEEALANELAAKFYLDWGKETIAEAYMQKAYYCYARWGAKAKTDQLEEKYPQLLAPILQQTKAAIEIDKTIEATQIFGSETSSSSSSVLDLASAIKASQAISEEISLDALLSKFMQIVLENAGADKGALILNQSGTWVEVARSVKGKTQLANIHLEEADSLPLSIINTVKRSQETLIINDSKKETTFAGDPYLIQEQPISLFCSPILHQGQQRGILYLENNLTPGAFTPDRIELLNLLSAQAAISLENAELYNSLEQKVKERTAELSDALENLKATQKQLVESEKMAALGGLVAGVAHEINTPIGTSITVASTLADETKSFLGAVASGQLKRSVLNNYLDLASESTQLMLSNLHRAGELIQSFKQIATDQSNLEQRRFNLKKYLEEIALSLAPKLKQTLHTLTVTGEETITIESYPGALAQITTNLVTNSLTHAYPSEQAGQLRLAISVEGDMVRIEYRDDGCGIDRENKGKIFEPFFTTARHQGGTGLGLHIVYNLVTQKLLGTIEVESEVGSGTKFEIVLPRSVN
ncbi:MAG: AAA family ATPase [Oscillatoria sp. SIO1A7]|nr:AAA family ATPase [Oscillatoria sp. SIO1A7]